MIFVLFKGNVDDDARRNLGRAWRKRFAETCGKNNIFNVVKVKVEAKAKERAKKTKERKGKRKSES